MSAQEEHPKIILFHYDYSPYAHKVSWYLNLRGIKYHECIQPPVIPRPDLHSLGVTYRRIPILSIGNDIYCDTHLILRELERRFPDGGLDTDPAGSKEFGSRSDAAFPFAAGCIPTNLKLMMDEGFQKDRTAFSGRSWSKEEVEKRRPEALKGLRGFFEHIESVFADGRKWVLGGDSLTLADIEAVWAIEWMATLPGALAGSDITPSTFPHTFSFISRFTSKLPKSEAVDIKGPEAKEIILSYNNDQTASSSSTTGDVGVPNDDPSGVTFGEEVEIAPVDSGKDGPQRGRVRELSKDVVVVEVVPTGEYNGGRAVRVHFPRRGFTIKSLSAKGDARL